MSLYNRSSLIQVPSLYKDGTLVSTIPEDRSGDFTVARGSNLAATRIGEDGYIKKGYENLLLQSNSFTTSPWTNFLINPPTSNQAGYDGTNNAWLIECISTSNFNGVRQTISTIGVTTLSVYAKAGTTNFLGFFSSAGFGAFELTGAGTTGQLYGNAIDSKIELISNGWYRCSIVLNGNASAVIIGARRTINSFNADIGDSIYIQDAQLNQGLVAYPYLETTTAPAQGGLLENTPRVDWSNGVPAVQLEEQRTNILPYSEYFDGFTYNTEDTTLVANNEISPEGLQNAYKITADAVFNYHRIRQAHLNISTSIGNSYTISIFAKSNGHDFILFRVSQIGAANRNVSFNISTGAVDFKSSVFDNTSVEDYGNGWYRCGATFTSDDPTMEWYLRSQPTTQIGIDDGIDRYTGDGVNGAYIYGAQFEDGYPTSYIPTYVTSQTRSNEVISDNFNIPTTATIYNSFYSDTAETVFVLDQVFNVAEGLNKVAIAFSPTAVKISVGGSIVANATGTYDTTALSNIQLGSNNGTDYSNAPISGFYVFPEFLTDEELNSLTD